ncbi:hypothetical protein BU16DRAFT_532093 [Lophium mytilinum]|uniref:Uncharacterized protein n=1 Tax=Lophium mytilinum TaxID=390894 RepID=A0A6A6Q869_9PEZI|nr:hypothetical protein BU16DRAFT_532093 [Lophium mytilinum]
MASEPTCHISNIQLQYTDKQVYDIHCLASGIMSLSASQAPPFRMTEVKMPSSPHPLVPSSTFSAPRILQKLTESFARLS